jgi:RNA polymerase II subunit A-like phosphatase
MEEALRYDKDRAQRLIHDRRLSLIVDLDQTIVHATVDPTVGEWIEDAERFEVKKKEKLEKNTGDTSGTSEAVFNTDDDNDEVNPNWDALKDVKRFKLGGEGQTWRNKGKSVVDDGGCYYYIKPRCVC